MGVSLLIPPPVWAEGHQALVPISGFGIATAFLFGLLGSTHCFGMCGPLVGLYAQQLQQDESDKKTPVQRQHLLYNLGRLIAYVDLGFILGSLGWLFGFYPWASGTLGIIAGAFVVVMGFHFLMSGTSWLGIDRLLARPTQLLVGMWRRLKSLANSPGIIVLGALHGLLPCPLLYVMFSSAIALQDPLQSALLLLSFSLGTVPMMWGIGIAAHSLLPQQRVLVQRVFGGVVLVWGAVLIMHGVGRLG